MEPIRIEATNTTPAVSLDQKTGKLELSGNSRPENIFAFYDPIIDWLKIYEAQPCATTSFSFKLHYFNSASAKIIHGIVNLLAQISKAGNTVEIKWHYVDGDDESLESGKDYASLVSVPFQFIREASM